MNLIYKHYLNRRFFLKNIEQELHLKEKFKNGDYEKLYVRLIQSNGIEDPYTDVYLKLDKYGRKDDESIYRWTVSKRKRRIVKEGQIIIPLLKVSNAEDTWLFMNLLEVNREINIPQTANNPYGCQSHHYFLLSQITKYKAIDDILCKHYQVLELNFHRERKHQWPLIKYYNICNNLII